VSSAPAPTPENTGAAPAFRLPQRVTVAGLATGLAGVGYRAVATSTLRRRDLYLDTQDGRLHRAGVRLRRRDPDGVWQVVAGGWIVAEQPARREAPPATGPAGGRAATLAGGHRLLPQALVRATGTRLTLLAPVGVEVELDAVRLSFAAPDGGTAVPGPRVLLLERPTAAPAETRHLEAVLRDLLRLRRSPDGPLEAALAALALPLPGAPVPDALRLAAGDTMAAAARKVLARQAYKMWANTAGTIADLDVEFLHDLRVATRRARSALRLLAPLYGEARSEALRAELAWIAAALGAVRDLDVHRERVRAELERAGAAAGQDAGLSAALARRRVPALAALRDALRCERFAALVAALRTLEVPADAPPEAVALAAASVVAIAPELIARAARRVRRWEERIGAGASNEELHRLRILFKRLRYTAEFFAEPYGEPMRAAIARLVPFQDCLGALQDAVVALATLAEHAEARAQRGRPRPAELLTLGALMQVQREEIARRRETLAELWSGLPGALKALRRAAAPPPEAAAEAG
jgi:CHAD domain-containing protein